MAAGQGKQNTWTQWGWSLKHSKMQENSINVAAPYKSQEESWMRAAKAGIEQYVTSTSLF